MNQLRRVVHQPHCIRLAKARPMTPRNERDPQAVKAGRDSALPEKVVYAPIFVPREPARYFSPFARQPRKRWFQAWVDGNGKILPWVCVAALGIANANAARLQVDILQRDFALGKPAAGVEADFKGDPHPVRLAAQFATKELDLLVREFRFYLGGFPGDAETCYRVAFAKLTADRLVDQLREEFDLQQGGVVADSPAVDRGGQSPAQKGVSVRVSDLPGVDNVLLSQKPFNGLPCGRVPALGFGSLPVRRDVAGNPRIESRVVRSGAELALLNGCLLGKPLSLAGVAGVVVTQAGGLLNPLAAVEVAFPNLPERGAGMLSQVGHPARVTHRVLKATWIRVVPCGRCVDGNRTNTCRRFLPLHYEAPLSRGKPAAVSYECPISPHFITSETFNAGQEVR